jgi:hypothetical protein
LLQNKNGVTGRAPIDYFHGDFMDFWWLIIPAAMCSGMPLLVKFSQKVETLPKIEAVDPSQ